MNSHASREPPGSASCVTGSNGISHQPRHGFCFLLLFCSMLTVSKSTKHFRSITPSPSVDSCLKHLTNWEQEPALIPGEQLPHKFSSRHRPYSRLQSCSQPQICLRNSPWKEGRGEEKVTTEAPQSARFWKATGFIFRRPQRPPLRKKEPADPQNARERSPLNQEPIAQISCAKGCSALCPPSWVSQEPGHRWLFLGKSVFSFLPCVGLDFPAFGGNIIVCGWGGFDEGKSILKRSSSSPQYYRTWLQIHFFISLGDGVSVCCPGWPGIHGSPAFAT